MAPAVRQARPEGATAEEGILLATLRLLAIPDAVKGVEFSATMFRKPNVPGLEAILYQCYAAMRGRAQAKKHFKGAYPWQDARQQKEYHKLLQQWFKDLKEGGQLESSSNMTASVLRNPQGAKVVSFLCDLTHAALQAEHSRSFPDDDLAPPADVADARVMAELGSCLVAVARGRLDLQCQRYLELTQQAAALQESQEQHAARLRDQYYQLQAQRAQLQGLLAEAGQPQPVADDGDAQQPVERLQPIKLDPMPFSSTDGLDDAGAEELWRAARQQSDAADLWEQLERHLAAFERLQGLVQGVVGSEGHPYAIDGAQLRRQAGDAEGGVAGGLLPGGGAPEVDILAVLEAWLQDVNALAGALKQLAGELPGPSGVAAPSPLVAATGAHCHAPHLSAQLSVHTAAVEQMRALKSTVAAQLERAEAAVAELDGRIDALLSLQQEQAQQFLQEAGLLTDAEAEAARAAAATPPSTVPAAVVDSMAAGAGEAPAPAWLAGVMLPGTLQPLAPTPMLRRMAFEQAPRQPDPPQADPSGAAAAGAGSKQQQPAAGAPASGGSMGRPMLVPKLNLASLSPPGQQSSPLQGVVAAAPATAPVAPPAGAGSSPAGGLTFSSGTWVSDHRASAHGEGGDTPPFMGQGFGRPPAPAQAIAAAPQAAAAPEPGDADDVSTASGWASLDEDQLDDLPLAPHFGDLDGDPPAGDAPAGGLDVAQVAAPPPLPLDLQGAGGGLIDLAAEADGDDEFVLIATDLKSGPGGAVQGGGGATSGADGSGGGGVILAEVSPLSSEPWTECAKPRRLSFSTGGKPGQVAPQPPAAAAVPAAGAAQLATPAPAIGGAGPPAAVPSTAAPPETAMDALRQRFAQLQRK